MATLVLSTVGTALGGPVGGMLGSLVGGAIDLQLMGGGPRKGPRLNDLAVQTSSYGTPIPQVFGTMRVAGTIIWATDLVETEELVGDAKSGGETLVYNYTVSFAVALSARRARAVRRVWADGKLIRGVAGDLKVEGTMRFVAGDERQVVDPVIATIEGIGAAPAYRGMALVVFEDLALAGFGNRIPNLTFEIVADEGPVQLADVVAEATAGIVRADGSGPIYGYAWHGREQRGALLPLIEGYGIDLADKHGRLETTAGSTRVIERIELGAGAVARIERRREPAANMPTDISLSYYDPERDYQAGAARASLPVGQRRSEALDLPLVATASVAKGLAGARLQKAWLRRERMIVRLPLSRADLAPGQIVAVAGEVGEWFVERQSIEHMMVELTLVARGAAVQSLPADGGRAVPSPDVIALPSRLALLNLPEGAIEGVQRPSLQLAVASPSNTWQIVPIDVAVAGTSFGTRSAAREAIIGSVDGTLAAGTSGTVVADQSIDITLVNPEKWLVSADEATLAIGANLAAIGDELVQFATAEPLGAGRFRLSGLRRGLRGSEAAVTGHGPGETFVLIIPDALKVLPFQPAQIGALATVTALGVGNIPAPSISRVIAV